MPCPHHKNLCAYPDWRADRCEFCHASWEKITALATAPRWGYGELPLNHFWRHAVDEMRLVAKRRPAARKAVA